MNYTLRVLALTSTLLMPQLPAHAQTVQTKRVSQPTAPVDPCKPIGRTEDGKLVYGINCTTLPTRTPPEAAAEVKIQPEIVRSGIFGSSYGQR